MSHLTGQKGIGCMLPVAAPRIQMLHGSLIKGNLCNNKSTHYISSSKKYNLKHNLMWYIYTTISLFKLKIRRLVMKETATGSTRHLTLPANLQSLCYWYEWGLRVDWEHPVLSVQPLSQHTEGAQTACPGAPAEEPVCCLPKSKWRDTEMQSISEPCVSSVGTVCKLNGLWLVRLIEEIKLYNCI